MQIKIYVINFADKIKQNSYNENIFLKKKININNF